MDLDFIVTINYGEDGPGEGEPSPEPDDIARWIRLGMAKEAWTSVNVSCKRT